MKKYGFLLLIGVIVSLIIGCGDPVYYYSWDSIELHILNYTDADVEATLIGKNENVVTAVIPSSGISMTRDQFKKSDDSNTSINEYDHTFFVTDYSSDIYRIGMDKAVQLGSTYRYYEDIASVKVTQNSQTLYESNLYLDHAFNKLSFSTPNAWLPNIYSVIPFEKDTIDEVYIYWVKKDKDNKDMLLKCYIGIFPAE